MLHRPLAVASACFPTRSLKESWMVSIKPFPDSGAGRVWLKAIRQVRRQREVERLIVRGTLTSLS